MKSKRIFNAYEAGEYTEMQKMLAQLTPTQYMQQVRLDELTLLHHVAYSGNIEAFNAIAELPYFKDIVDESNNEVIQFFDNLYISKDGHLYFGLLPKNI